MSTNQYDVAILGLGPVGSMAGILLTHAGLKVAAIERDPKVYALPRAVNLDGEIVRSLQPLNLAEKFNAVLQPVRPDERAGFANSKREWLFGSKARAFGSNGWQPMNFFDQPELEALLRNQAVAHPNMDAYIGCSATSFVDDGNAVHIDIAAAETGAEAERHLSAKYLLACDGASSFTRRALGIGWVDLGYDHDWLVVDVITKPGHTLGVATVQVCDPDRICTYVCTKDPYRRWEFKLNDGETWDEMLQPAKIASLIEAWTPPGTYEIRRAAMYTFHAATADRWQDGRVFIAGDAAHQTPPFLGQGMNAGMRDVINFAWKLPMVIQGIASEQLLQTYAEERDAHAHDLVEWAVSIGRLMEHLAAQELAMREGREAPPTPTQLQSSGYGQGREQPPLRAGVLITEQVSDQGATGYLFAQPMVVKDGQETRFDDLLGPGFAVVGKTMQDLVFNAASEKVLAQLGARVLSLQGLQAVRGHFDRAFESANVVVVRPDRYVFGHTSATLSVDDLVRRLAQSVYLNEA